MSSWCQWRRLDRLNTLLVKVLVEAAVFSVDSRGEWQWIGSAATCVGVGGGGSAVSRVDSGSAVRPRVSEAGEAAGFVVGCMREWQ